MSDTEDSDPVFFWWRQLYVDRVRRRVQRRIYEDEHCSSIEEMSLSTTTSDTDDSFVGDDESIGIESIE